VTLITNARVFWYARGWHVIGVPDGRGWPTMTTAVKAVSPDGRTFQTLNTTYQLETALEWHEDLPRTLPNT